MALWFEKHKVLWSYILYWLLIICNNACWKQILFQFSQRTMIGLVMTLLTHLLHLLLSWRWALYPFWAASISLSLCFTIPSELFYMIYSISPIISALIVFCFFYSLSFSFFPTSNYVAMRPPDFILNVLIPFIILPDNVAFKAGFNSLELFV